MIVVKTAFDLLKDITSYNRDIQRIIAYIKNTPYENVIFSPEKIELSDDEVHSFYEFLSRYKKHEPISKIIGQKKFWTHTFFVDSSVLDPRPETELIIEEVIAQFNNINESFNFLDIGAGSGCILLSILSELKKSNGIGIDISKNAIDVAEKNKDKLKIENATFLNISWNEIFSFLERKEINIDVIVSNPPYIRTADIDFLDDSVKNFDPHIALDGGKDGLSAYKEICYVAKNILRKNQKRTEEKYIFLEVGYDQAEYVKNILEENEFFNIAFSRDLSGINRVVIARII